MEDKERIPLKLDLIGKYPIRWTRNFINYKDIEDFFKRNPNRKVIIFDTGFYDDEYFEKFYFEKFKTDLYKKGSDEN